jgi:glutamine synthetase
MELMQKVAKRHGLVCLLHEKPFAGVNGSGKHNNWSLATDTGMNLLDPGKSPMENKQFLLFLAAVVKAVDEYQDLLRISVASAGNDHRLGANEAPPAIVSIFLGEELMGVVEAIEKDEDYLAPKKGDMEMGVRVLPNIPKDSTDRNRTSPFAFTGNKFEFRMLGSSFSIAGPNYVINTIVAESLSIFADALEGAADFDTALAKIIRDTFIAHKRILFNGNNYAAEWVVEAEKRGLLNLKSTVEALPLFVSEKNIKLFEKHCILSGTEVHSRLEIQLENYVKVINIEAITSLDIARQRILPAVMMYSGKLVKIASDKAALGVTSSVEKDIAAKISDLAAKLYDAIDKLDAAISHESEGDTFAHATYCHETIIPAMNAVREIADALELICADSDWPMPSYAKLLFEI